MEKYRGNILQRFEPPDFFSPSLSVAICLDRFKNLPAFAYHPSCEVASPFSARGIAIHGRFNWQNEFLYASIVVIAERYKTRPRGLKNHPSIRFLSFSLENSKLSKSHREEKKEGEREKGRGKKQST